MKTEKPIYELDAWALSSYFLKSKNDLLRITDLKLNDWICIVCDQDKWSQIGKRDEMLKNFYGKCGKILSFERLGYDAIIELEDSAYNLMLPVYTCFFRKLNGVEAATKRLK